MSRCPWLARKCLPPSQACGFSRQTLVGRGTNPRHKTCSCSRKSKRLVFGFNRWYAFLLFAGPYCQWSRMFVCLPWCVWSLPQFEADIPSQLQGELGMSQFLCNGAVRYSTICDLDWPMYLKGKPAVNL